jgi:hypothetical protein
MIEVKLPLEHWQQVLAILARAPWSEANPLIMGIGEQVRARVDEATRAAAKRGNGVDAEAAHEGRPE